MRNPTMSDKIEFIWDFWTDPCDAPLTVYLRCLWPAFLKLIIQYYAFDPLQAFTGFVSPSGGLKVKRGSPHGQGKQRKGGRRTWKPRWQRWTSFDPSDYLGRKLQTPFGLNGRPVSPGVGTMWNVYGAQQQLVNKIFVVNLVTEAIYDWSMALATTEYCQAVLMPIAVGFNPSDRGSGILEFWPLTFPIVEKARNGAGILGDGGYTGAEYSNALLTGKMKIDNPAYGPFIVSIRTANGLISYSQEIPYPGGDFAVSLSSAENEVYHCAVSGPGFFDTTDQRLVVWSRLPEPPPPDWFKLIAQANGLTPSSLQILG